jgi:predicted PurR-regulated permease PerM
MGIFWPTVTCLYLIISFITFDWGRTWLIWLVAGVIHTLIKNIVKVGE